MTGPDELAGVLNATADMCDTADSPVSGEQAQELLAAVHHAGEAIGGLHDQIAGCFAPLDGRGRCIDCGRRVAWVHDKRGCMFAVPFAIAELVLSLPLLGKALFLAQRTLRGRS